MAVMEGDNLSVQQTVGDDRRLSIIELGEADLGGLSMKVR
jgi:hypothetical protein